MNSPSVAIVDYGMGNVRSVFNACESLGAYCQIAATPRDLENANVESLILPGVGAFGDAMQLLRDGGWLQALHQEVIENEKPILGICLGMQLLASVGYEFGEHRGLGWIEGEVKRLPSSEPQFRVPHIGWNEIEVASRDGIYADFIGNPTFYFVHSFAFYPQNLEVATSWCQHSTRWCASVQQGHIFGVQFHPEKSQRDGLRLINNFLKWKAPHA